MNILIGSASSIATPPAGEATLFINTDDANILSYKLPDGTVERYNDSSEGISDCCSCEIAKSMSDSVACALKSGFISITEFNSFVSNGLTVTTTENTDVDGNKTCTVSIGPKTQP